MLEIRKYKISTVTLIDDDERTRTEYADLIEQLELIPDVVQDRIESLEEFINGRQGKAQAAVCDHHLTHSAFSSVNGAEIVKSWYVKSFPAILCTRWDNINAIRKYREYIPVLVPAEDLDPDTIINGFRQCINEFEGNPSKERRAWRAIVRVEYVEEESVRVIVSGWNDNEGIELARSDFPISMRDEITEERRLRAYVNLGAEHERDLYFKEWELL